MIEKEIELGINERLPDDIIPLRNGFSFMTYRVSDTEEIYKLNHFGHTLGHYISNDLDSSEKEGRNLLAKLYFEQFFEDSLCH